MNKTTRILVVDDNPDVLQTFSIILRADGYEVWEASTGQQALQLTRERHPDLVLLDVVLPDLSGIEVCSRIKTDPALPDVFVVLISGMATSADSQVDGLETGADEYLVKPVDVDVFRARIRTLARLRHTTAALRASEEHYRKLIEILPDALSVMDLQGRMIAVNQQAVQMLGYASQEELLATSAFDLTPSESHERLGADLARTLETGAVRDVVHTLIRKNGDRCQVELSAVVSTEACGQPARIIVVGRDITMQKRAEEELRNMSRRIIEAQEGERLRLARELHDGVNQIIASAKLRLRHLAGSLAGLDPHAAESLRRCCDLLAQALEENRRVAQNLRPSDLDTLGLAAACRNLCKEVQSRTTLKVRCTTARLGARLPPPMELNLFRIVQEALYNVEQHARAKTIRVRITSEGSWVVLSIEDDGRGIWRKASKAGRARALGIGLSSMRDRAASLGGTCEVESAPNQGTRISVRVPAVAKPESHLAKPIAPRDRQRIGSVG